MLVGFGFLECTFGVMGSNKSGQKHWGNAKNRPSILMGGFLSN
jgi:hypothetical protein